MPEGFDLKERFPGLEGRVYLNSCSYGLPPRSVSGVYAEWQQAMAHFEDDEFGLLYARLEEFTQRLARFIGSDPGGVWVDQNSSSLLSRIALGLPRDKRCRVVVTDLEFPSAELVFGAIPHVELVVVASQQGVVDAEQVADAIDERTWVVFASHVTTATGALLNTAPIVEQTRKHGVWFGLDVYQSVGCLPVNVTDLGADFAVGGGHKWMLGAWDLGYAWMSPKLLGSFRPRSTGWMAGAEPFTFQPQRAFATDARCLATGAPDPLASMLSDVGLDEIEAAGLDAIRERSLSLVEQIIERSRWPVVGPVEAERRGGTVCLAIPDAVRVRAELLKRNIVVSARVLPSGAQGVRISPHFYNSESDIATLFGALAEIVP